MFVCNNWLYFQLESIPLQIRSSRSPCSSVMLRAVPPTYTTVVTSPVNSCEWSDERRCLDSDVRACSHRHIYDQTENAYVMMQTPQAHDSRRAAKPKQKCSSKPKDYAFRRLRHDSGTCSESGCDWSAANQLCYDRRFSLQHSMHEHAHSRCCRDGASRSNYSSGLSVCSDRPSSHNRGLLACSCPVSRDSCAPSTARLTSRAHMPPSYSSIFVGECDSHTSLLSNTRTTSSSNCD